MRILIVVGSILLIPALSVAQPEDAKQKFNEALKAAKKADAIAAYEAAITLAGAEDYPQARINVGALYYEKGDLKKAAAHLNKAVALDSSNTDALKSLGQIHLKAEDFKSALVPFELYLKAKPKDDGVWMMLATSYKGLKNEKKRLEALTQAAAANPKNKVAHYNIGNIHSINEDFSKAMSAYRKAIAIDPKYVGAYYNLAIASQQVDWEACVPDYQAFVKAAGTKSKWKKKVAQARDIIKQINDYLDVKE